LMNFSSFGIFDTEFNSSNRKLLRSLCPLWEQVSLCSRDWSQAPKHLEFESIELELQLYATLLSKIASVLRISSSVSLTVF
jgi:hypothetical protein